MKAKLNEIFNKAAIYGIRFLWKVADADTKKSILKELTPKRVRKVKDGTGNS